MRTTLVQRCNYLFKHSN